MHEKGLWATPVSMHNVVSYPSGYPFCSTRYYFMKDFGIRDLNIPIVSWKEERKFIPWKVKLPPGYLLNQDGLLIQENILQTHMVEHYYGTPRKFSYYMNKLSSEEWTVLHIESWMGTQTKELLDNEKITGKTNRIRKEEKLKLTLLLKHQRASPNQIARCLAIT